MSFAFPGFESCRSHDGSYRLNASLRQCACDGFGSYTYCGMLSPSFGRDITVTYEWLGGSVSTRKCVRAGNVVGATRDASPSCKARK
jgi:hypothetical protein